MEQNRNLKVDRFAVEENSTRYRKLRKKKMRENKKLTGASLDKKEYSHPTSDSDDDIRISKILNNKNEELFSHYQDLCEAEELLTYHERLYQNGGYPRDVSEFFSSNDEKRELLYRYQRFCDAQERLKKYKDRKCEQQAGVPQFSANDEVDNIFSQIRKVHEAEEHLEYYQRLLSESNKLPPGGLEFVSRTWPRASDAAEHLHDPRLKDSTQHVSRDKDQNPVKDAARKIYEISMKMIEMARRMGSSLSEMASSGQRKMYLSPVDGLVLVHDDMVELENDLHLQAKAWIVPDKERKGGEPSWALTKAGYVVETEYVSNIVSRVKEAIEYFSDLKACLEDVVEGKPSRQMIRVFSPLAGSGLSSALRMAAFTCAKKTQVYSVYFLDSSQDQVECIKFLTLVNEDKPLVIFVDCEVSASLLQRVMMANPFNVVVLGTRQASDHDDVIVKTVWSKPSLERMYRIMSNFEFPNKEGAVQKALCSAMREMESRGKGSFYLLPWIASRGLYTPVQHCIEAQATAAVDAKQAEIVNLIAFLSLTTSQAVVLKENLDPQMYPLLVIHEQMKTGGFSYRFAHPAMAASYLHHVFNSDSKMRFKSIFPADYLELWQSSIGKMIGRDAVQNDLKQITQEILFAFEDHQLTPFVEFVTKQELNRDFLFELENTCDKVGIPAVNKFLLLSRMCRSNRWFLPDLALMYAEFAVECVMKKSDEFKARGFYVESLVYCAVEERDDPTRRTNLYDKAMAELAFLTKDSLVPDNFRKVLHFEQQLARIESHISELGTMPILGKKRSCSRRAE